jgi:hypothetical protein
MKRLKRAVIALMVGTGITLVAGSAPVVAATTSAGSPRVFHCC